MMNINHKKRILAIGNAIELTGNITIAAAAIFAIVAPYIILAIAIKKNNKENSSGSINFNVISFNSPRSNHCSHYYSYYQHSNFHFYRNLVVVASIASIVAVGLAIAFEVYWVGITVVGLWAAGLALSALGRAMIDYGLSLPDIMIDSTLPLPAIGEPIASPCPDATPVQSAENTDTLVQTEGVWQAYYTPQFAQLLG